jgi:hypothetical protein
MVFGFSVIILAMATLLRVGLGNDCPDKLTFFSASRIKGFPKFIFRGSCALWMEEDSLGAKSIKTGDHSGRLFFNNGIDVFQSCSNGFDGY